MVIFLLSSKYAFPIFIVSILSICHASNATWITDARASYNEDLGRRQTMDDSCGYNTPIQYGYGREIVALSTPLFRNGEACGSCYIIQCINSRWCLPGSIRVTATNFCPPNPTRTRQISYCNPPQKHFELSEEMFTKIGAINAGVIPVQYRRVACSKRGGIRFLMKAGNSGMLVVLVYNVGGAGDVVNLKIKGSNSGNWLQMSRIKGQIWQIHQNMVGQGLSFQVTTSFGNMVQSVNVVPPNWQFGQTFEGRNF